ncbi:MAG: hypothetical protein ACR2P1_04930 [Pseudomonadales bacterium]
MYVLPFTGIWFYCLATLHAVCQEKNCFVFKSLAVITYAARQGFAGKRTAIAAVSSREWRAMPILSIDYYNNVGQREYQSLHDSTAR